MPETFIILVFPVLFDSGAVSRAIVKQPRERASSRRPVAVLSVW